MQAGRVFIPIVVETLTNGDITCQVTNKMTTITYQVEVQHEVTYNFITIETRLM